MPESKPSVAGFQLRHLIAIAVAAALAILIAYHELTDRPIARPPPDASDAPDRSVPEHGAADRRSPSSDREDTLEDALTEPVLLPAEDASSLPDPVRAADLMAELAKMKPEGARFVSSEVEAINRRIAELKDMGEAALPAIRDYLLATNPGPSAASGEKTADPLSLRVSLLEALSEIPGREALELMAQLVGMTADPQDLDLLAQALERRARGTYRGPIASSARQALGMALQSDPGAFRNIGYLFAVLQDYGDASIAADLETVAQEGSAWGDYAIMLLSRLREGYGIGGLIRVAYGLAEGTASARYAMAVQMLGQAARGYPEAGDALLQLARDGKIGTPVWVELAAMLGGSERELVSRSFGLFARSRPLTQLNADARETWSDGDIDQRLGLIGRLITTGPEPAAVTALQQAQRGLQDWRSRPMVNGKRARS